MVKPTLLKIIFLKLYSLYMGPIDLESLLFLMILQHILIRLTMIQVRLMILSPINKPLQVLNQLNGLKP